MIVLTANGSFAKAYKALDNAEIISARELSENDFIEKLAKAKTVIHNASSLDCPDLPTAVEKNFDYTRRLISILQSVNPSVHLVLLSSMSILDSNDVDSYGNILTMSPYSYSKFLSETYSLKCGLKHLSCVRFSTLFYKDPLKDGLSRLVRDATLTGQITLINDGEDARDFLPIDIAARYVNEIIKRRPNGNKIYTLASGQPRTFGQVAKILAQHLPSLEVSNVKQEKVERVLSDFHTRDINDLGHIPFNLETEITKFAEELKK